MVIMRNIYCNFMERFVAGSFQYRIDNARAFCGVGLHFLVFLIVKLAGLSKDGVIDRNLAQVMHRSCLDNVLAELFREAVNAKEHQHVLLVAGVLFYLIYQDLDDITCTSDVTTCRVVTALDHGSHAEEQSVMHLDDVFCFLRNLFRQPVVIVCKKLHVFS